MKTKEEQFKGEVGPVLLTYAQRVIRCIGPQKGTINRFDREIQFEIQGRVHSIKELWVYDCTLIDCKTKISIEEKHWKSPQGALEHAVDHLAHRLRDAGEI